MKFFLLFNVFNNNKPAQPLCTWPAAVRRVSRPLRVCQRLRFELSRWRRIPRCSGTTTGSTLVLDTQKQARRRWAVRHVAMAQTREAHAQDERIAHAVTRTRRLYARHELGG